MCVCVCVRARGCARRGQCAMAPVCGVQGAQKLRGVQACGWV